jgi:hypothetical protein
MALDLEHQERVAVEDGARRPVLRARFSLDKRRAMLYAGLALLPVLIFGLMVAMAGK